MWHVELAVTTGAPCCGKYFQRIDQEAPRCLTVIVAYAVEANGVYGTKCDMSTIAFLLWMLSLLLLLTPRMGLLKNLRVDFLVKISRNFKTQVTVTALWKCLVVPDLGQ